MSCFFLYDSLVAARRRSSMICRSQGKGSRIRRTLYRSCALMLLFGLVCFRQPAPGPDHLWLRQRHRQRPQRSGCSGRGRYGARNYLHDRVQDRNQQERQLPHLVF